MTVNKPHTKRERNPELCFQLRYITSVVQGETDNLYLEREKERESTGPTVISEREIVNSRFNVPQSTGRKDGISDELAE